MKPQLLIDADIVAFKAAARAETLTAFGKTVAPLEDCLADIDQMIDGYLKRLKAFAPIMALSCREANFREAVLPTYKHSRNKSADSRPTYLTEAKAHLRDQYESVLRYSLEGDDVLGILHTHKDYGDTIIVSEDKDLRTVPGRLVEGKLRKSTGLWYCGRWAGRMWPPCYSTMVATSRVCFAACVFGGSCYTH